MTKNSVCLTPYLRNRASHDRNKIAMCKMMVVSPAIFFQNVFFWGVLGGKKGQKWTKIINLSLFFAVSQEL